MVQTFLATDIGQVFLVFLIAGCFLVFIAIALGLGFCVYKLINSERRLSLAAVAAPPPQY
ncbi:hydrophobic protein [Persimmon ampelovirus]|nr:hydrophobic protein [Persimmon ampelovirus]